MDEDLPTYLKDRIEKNRQKALALKKSKLVHHPYSKGWVTQKTHIQYQFLFYTYCVNNCLVPTIKTG